MSIFTTKMNLFKVKRNKSFSLLANRQSFMQPLVLPRSFITSAVGKSVGSAIIKICSSEIFIEAFVAVLSVVGRGRITALLPRFALGGTAAETARSTINSLGDHQVIGSMLNNSIRGLRPSGLFESQTTTSVSEVANTMNTVIQSVANTPVAESLVVGATTVGTAAVSSGVGVGGVLFTPFKAVIGVTGSLLNTDVGFGFMLLGSGLLYVSLYEWLFKEKLLKFFNKCEFVILDTEDGPKAFRAYDIYSALPLLNHWYTQLSEIGSRELFFWFGVPAILIIAGGWYMLRGTTKGIVNLVTTNSSEIKNELENSKEDIVGDVAITVSDVAKDVVVSSVTSSTGL